MVLTHVKKLKWSLGDVNPLNKTIMKRLTTLLMTLMLMSAALWADETVTVSANSSDISEGLDLKVVAKLFAEAKNLEEFENMLNNPDSAFCNLDLNGDGQVDYLRVVEIGDGNKRLIVLQAVLAKDIYQDVASIYVEKKDNNEVSVQVVGDEYVYGTNYIIEPVYVYRPVIYDWFWSDAWFAWHSPWYWGDSPAYWYAHTCWAHDWYWHHCYAFHHHHHGCSFRHAHEVRLGYNELHSGVTRREYANAHPERTFTARNAGKTNAREIRGNASGATSRRANVSAESGRTIATQRTAPVESRTYGSRNTAVTRTASSGASTRGANVATSRSSNANVATSRSNANVATSRSSNANVATSRSNANVSTSRSSNANVSTSRSSNANVSTSRSASSYNITPSRSSYSGGSFSGSSYSGSSYSGGGSRGGGGGGSGATRR